MDRKRKAALIVLVLVLFGCARARREFYLGRDMLGILDPELHDRRTRTARPRRLRFPARLGVLAIHYGREGAIAAYNQGVERLMALLRKDPRLSPQVLRPLPAGRRPSLAAILAAARQARSDLVLVIEFDSMRWPSSSPLIVLNLALLPMTFIPTQWDNHRVRANVYLVDAVTGYHLHHVRGRAADFSFRPSLWIMLDERGSALDVLVARGYEAVARNLEKLDLKGYGAAQ